MRYQRTGRKGPKANQSNPPHCKMATAIVLPLCWGKKLPEHGGSFPWERGRQGGLLLLPLPTFLRAVEESSWPVSTPIALRGLGDFWPLNWRAEETTGEESPSSLASTIVTGPIAAASRASPCGLLPQRSRDSVQEHPKARGGAGREEKLTWGGQDAVAAAARAGLDEQSHSPAATLRRRGSKKQRAGGAGLSPTQQVL